MNRFIKNSIFLLLLLTSIKLIGQENYKDITKVFEYDAAKSYPVPHFNKSDYKFKSKPKTIILLIGDGMGLAQIYAGYTANKGYLNLFNMNVIGFTNTQSFSSYITDSAAGGTALACGEKTNNGYIGLDAKKDTIHSILYYAQQAKKSTGLISTSSITHATPAAFVAHVEDRAEYELIALDFLRSNIDLFIGGGEMYFEDRKDERNLSEELRQKGYTVKKDVASINDETKLPLAVLTSEAHNLQYLKRGDVLPQATKKALTLLSPSKKGFFLMIEGSQIDWGGHKNDVGYIIEEMLDFDRAIGEALEFARKDKNTLVIVTADHETGGMSIVDGNLQLGSVTASFSTGQHTGIMVPIFAYGCGASEFGGIYDNKDVFYKMMSALGLKK